MKNTIARKVFALANAALLSISLITMTVPAAAFAQDAQPADTVTTDVADTGSDAGTGAPADTSGDVSQDPAPDAGTTDAPDTTGSALSSGPSITAPGVSCSLTATPSIVAPGDTTTLSLTSSTGVTSATITNSDDEVNAIDPNGTMTDTLTETYTYTATVTGTSNADTGTCTATVKVTPTGDGPITTTPPPSCTIVSSEKTQEDGHDSAVLTFVHNAWTHVLDATGAKWIWGEDGVTDPQTEQTEVFTRTFVVTGTPTSATVDIAADNGYDLTVNSTDVDNKLDVEDNFSATTTENILSALVPGTNTLTITVKNLAVAGSDPESNPAGLDYVLNINGATCSPTTVTPPPPTTDVKVCKMDENHNYLSGWQLTLRESNPVGSEDVSSSDGAALEQTIPNVSPGDYVARVTGTYVYRPGDPTASTSDAAYSLRLLGDPVYGGPYAPWVRENNFPPPNQGWLGVMINDSYTDWGSIFNPNPNHKYWTGLHIASTEDVNFNILDDQYSDNSGTLHVDLFKGYTGVTGNSGCITFQDVPYGDYELHEIHKAGWTRIDHNQDVTVNADTPSEIDVVNDDGKGPHANIVATKVVCDDEADLPNWGLGGHTIDANTATDFVNGTDGKCHLQPDWNFDWADQSGADSGDTATGTYPGYTAFGPTDGNGVASTSVPLTSGLTEIHMREELQDGYIPFTHQAHPDNSHDVSAEFYCANDALNYDNWDFIRGPVDGATYYCVAFNAPVTAQTATVKMCKTDDTEAHNPLGGWNLTLKGAHVDDLVVPTNSSSGVDTAATLDAGTSYLASATGTWSNQNGSNLVDAEYSTIDNWANHMDGYDGYQTDILELQANQTFDPNSNWGPYNSLHAYAQSFIQPANGTANFRIFDGTGTTQNEDWFADNSGTLAVSLDKGYSGITDAETGCVTFDNVPYGAYTAGETAQDGWTNVSGTGPVTVDAPEETFTIVNKQDVTSDDIRVHIFKYMDNGDAGIAQVPNGSDDPDFPMRAVYTISGLGSGNDPYVLGDGGGVFGSDDGLEFAANTRPLATGDSYATYEDTSEGSIIAANADSCTDNTPFYLEGYKVGDTHEAADAAGISGTYPDFPSIGHDEYVIVVNAPCSTDGGGGGQDSNYVVVTGDSAAGENQPGWLFNRDPETQSPYEFNTDSPDIGTGSLYVLPITNTVNGDSDKFIGELFLQKLISDVTSIKYDFKIGVPDDTAADQFYMSVYADFGDSSPTKFYDCRYNVVPTVGSTAGFTTVTFDPTVSTYDVQQSGSSVHTCPASPAGMNTIVPNSTIRAIALNVGDTSNSDTGVSGYLDNVIVDTPSLITTYDFEPTEQSGGDGGSSTHHSHGSSGGSVLGASTQGQVLGASTCGPLINTYMKNGWASNVPDQVSKLQTFLNGELGANIPVSGYFGGLTENLVRLFQHKYADDVIKPWIGVPDSGIDNVNDTTGYVYKTTSWKINMIYCPTLALTFPALP